MTDAFDIDAYFERIHLERPSAEAIASPTESLDVLKRIIHRHQLTFPFENLSVNGFFPVDPAHVTEHVSGERVSIQADKIFRKMVVDGRGGYCYEQNALFAGVLRALGYEFETVAGRVTPQTGEDLPFGVRVLALGHMFLLVTLPGSTTKYLCDVGFGGRGQPPSPLPLDASVTTTTRGGESYQLRRIELVRRDMPTSFSGEYTIQEDPEGSSWALFYQTHSGGEFHPSYVFSTVHTMAHADYYQANWYISTSPDSPFTKNTFVILRTDTGLKSVVGMEYKHVESGELVDAHEVSSRQELLELLSHVFSLHPPKSPHD
ncbi:unnamed protein product [Aphanomyces euteiches]|uniref:Uncharacterized protein n=1 Tax=Aphanomyces euteiches TaxID=100861 RepID=A0A6G0XDX1_9STRA|nr:hypothetical protein Ae201684_006175 [Aphanomyces euteiches]KAH9069040.1 hypothetical protein Ae201684P_004737 [Aphanomyces euteiches]KAH9134239.1 hypothetical protein AeRB84_019954 [Aphanomyces euteiches]